MTSNIATAQKVAEAHAQLRTRTDIQFDFPAPTPPAPPPAWLKWLAEHLNFNVPGGSLIFWIVAGAAVLLILFLVIRWLSRLERGSRAAADADADAAEWRPEESVARALLAEAEAMAAAGRFGEAVHLLLQRSLEDIGRRRPRLLRPALTSREIATIAELPRIVRTAFARMAAPVERSLFGGRTLTRDAWEEARDAYREFALPGSWA